MLEDFGLEPERFRLEWIASAGSARSSPMRRDHAACEKPLPALVLTGEQEDNVILDNMFSAIHRLLCIEDERLLPEIVDLGFDDKIHRLGSSCCEQIAEKWFAPPTRGV